MWKATILVAVAVFGFVDSCMYKGSECPEYKVVECRKEYEIRSYPALTWVTTSVVSSIRPYAQYETFMRLYNYTDGHNDREVKMGVTTPVRVESITYDDQTVYKIGIIVPARFATNPPTPRDQRVTFEREEPTMYAVRRFNGYVLRRSDWEDEAKLLAKIFKDDSSVNKNDFYEVGYDGRFEFFDRRNEIWMVKKGSNANKQA